MHKKHFVATLLYMTIVLVGLSGCGSKDEKEGEKPAETAEKLYMDARQEFAEGKYKNAVKSFEEVERQHPSSEWAVNAQVMSGYTSYRAAEYDTAVSTLERFAKLYPNNPSTPYAYYLIAICYYEQITDVGRDQKVTEQAMEALREVIRRFPESEYSRDAKIKLDLTQDHLAGKEMQVGRYYQRHDDYLAAINRFRYVVESFQTTSHVPEALHRLVESYLRLGVTDEAQRYGAVLGFNFPNSIWYRDSYALLNGGAKPRDDIDEIAAREAQEDKEKAEAAKKSASELTEPPADQFGVIRREAEPAPVGAVEDVTSKPAATEADKPAETTLEQAPEAKPDAKPESKEEGSSWWPFGSSDDTKAKPEQAPEVKTEAPAAKKDDGSSWWQFGSSDETKAKSEEKPVEKKEDSSSTWDHLLPW